MSDISIIINDREFPVYSELLVAMASDFPQDDRQLELKQELINLNLPSISSMLIRRGDNLPRQYMDDLWLNGNKTVRQALLTSSNFIRYLSDGQAREIIAANDRKMLEAIINKKDPLFLIYSDRRLSKTVEAELIRHIASTFDGEILSELYNAHNFPEEYLPTFDEFYIKKNNDIYIQRIVSRIEIGDIPYLSGFSPDFLKELAGNVKGVRNREARKKVSGFLLCLPDPEVKLALAENWELNKAALIKLSSDMDADIALEAKKSMAKRN